ncbi:branched-chain amino acid ABC transporter permease [Breznakiella homolactica]|uniref:Branched-chain amino acid ABC transporter permease n=1 Tax=Breznakiella homolactica TaxID=2798577 RepID=A0A7T7XLJ6_9SPIR|nr:branched-chain amino acid ABC transporter permease [Breznakiella homolactica]QQO08610.1 branched-chain amino acid ABC transporter permease [Breznakiella homolactica]
MKNPLLLVRKNKTLTLVAIVVIGLALLFLVGDPYVSHIIIIGGIYSFLAIGLNIVTGLCGQINLGMAGFYAIGSYTSAILSSRLGVSFWLAFPAAIVLSAVAGLIIGYPALKVRGGVYLVLVTTSFAGIIQTILTQWISLTKGPMGIVGIAAPSFFGKEIYSLQGWLILVYALVIVATILGERIEKSRVGRSLKAVRESDTSAQSLGINLAYYKILAFVLSAAFGGAGGSLYAHYMTTVSPDIYNMSLSVLVLTMIVVGGVGSIHGSLLGGVAVAVLPEILRPLGQFQMVVYSLLIVMATIFLKKGIIGLGMDAGNFFARTFGLRRKKNG